MKFISYNKNSTKAKRTDDLAKRVIWGFSPVTRIKQSKNVYNRKKEKIVY